MNRSMGSGLRPPPRQPQPSQTSQTTATNDRQTRRFRRSLRPKEAPDIPKTEETKAREEKLDLERWLASHQDKKQQSEAQARISRLRKQHKKLIAQAIYASLPPRFSTVLPAPTLQNLQSARLSEHQMQQLVEHVQLGATEGGEAMMQLSLHGEILDGLQLQVKVTESGLHVAFLSENPAVKRLLHANLELLQKKLREKELVLHTLEIRDPRDKQREQKRRQHQKDREQASH